MTKKEKMKCAIHNKIDELIEAVDKAGNIDYMEINIKHINGELIYNLSNSYKEKV